MKEYGLVYLFLLFFIITEVWKLSKSTQLNTDFLVKFKLSDIRKYFI